MANNKEQNPDDTVQLNCLVLRKQRDLLNEKAKAAGMTTAQFVQKLAIDANVVSKPDISAEIKTMNAWLGRLNSNINMLTKWCNTFKEGANAEIVMFRLAALTAQVNEIVAYSVDLRAQGYGKKRQPKKSPVTKRARAKA